jgi:1,4-dihydroxy-2-naphthoyl-CoA synthase
MTAASDYTEIIYEKNHRIPGAAWITINRPHRMNSTTQQTWREINSAVEDADADPEIGVIVLTGAGQRAFCAGGDVGEHPAEDPRATGFQHAGLLHGGIEDTLKPVIARVCGYAIGGGNHLAYHCDLTIACRDHAIFGQNGARVGAPTAGNFVQDLAYIVGLKRAKELWMMCRRYSADQAVEMGLANVAVAHDNLDAEVDLWCGELLERAPTSLALIKYVFRDIYKPLRDVSDPARYVSEVNPAFFGSDGEAAEGKLAFREKRPPHYTDYRANISGRLRKERAQSEAAADV